MQAVYEEAEEFLRVVLCVAWEHGIYAANCRFDAVWGKHITAITPHTFDELGVRFGELAFGAQNIGFVYFLFVETAQKIVGQRDCIR